MSELEDKFKQKFIKRLDEFEFSEETKKEMINSLEITAKDETIIDYSAFGGKRQIQYIKIKADKYPYEIRGEAKLYFGRRRINYYVGLYPFHVSNNKEVKVKKIDSLFNSLVDFMIEGRKQMKIKEQDLIKVLQEI